MSRKGENIYKRKDGRWEGRYIVSYNFDGKAKYRYLYGHTYTEVRRKLRVAGQREGRKKKSPDISVGDLARQYLKEEDNIKPSTRCIYERYIDNYISPFFKGIKLYRINTDVLQEFIDSLNYLSTSTISGIYCILKKTLKKAYKRNWVDCVWMDLKLPKAKKQNVEVFTKNEQKKIESVLDIKKNPNEIGIMICLYTGIRLGELCGLKWKDIDIPEKTLTVSRTAQRITKNGKSTVEELSPKSISSCRTIPIPAFLAEKLSQCERSACYVITTNGHITDPRTYQNQYRRILERAGVRYANFHTLRHTFSVRALEVGFDVKTLSEVLGHADATITLKRYAHSLDEHKRLCMEALSVNSVFCADTHHNSGQRHRQKNTFSKNTF